MGYNWIDLFLHSNKRMNQFKMSRRFQFDNIKGTSIGSYLDHFQKSEAATKDDRKLDLVGFCGLTKLETKQFFFAGVLGCHSLPDALLYPHQLLFTFRFWTTF